MVDCCKKKFWLFRYAMPDLGEEMKLLFWLYVRHFHVGETSKIGFIKTAKWQYRLWSFNFWNKRFSRLLRKSEVFQMILWYFYKCNDCKLTKFCPMFHLLNQRFQTRLCEMIKSHLIPFFLLYMGTIIFLLLTL